MDPPGGNIVCEDPFQSHIWFRSLKTQKIKENIRKMNYQELTAEG